MFELAGGDSAAGAGVDYAFLEPLAPGAVDLGPTELEPAGPTAPEPIGPAGDPAPPELDVPPF